MEAQAEEERPASEVQARGSGALALSPPVHVHVRVSNLPWTTSGASGTTSSRWACGDEREPVVRAIWRARTAMNAKLYDATKLRLRRCELAEDARGE